MSKKIIINGSLLCFFLAQFISASEFKQEVPNFPLEVKQNELSRMGSTNELIKEFGWACRGKDFEKCFECIGKYEKLLGTSLSLDQKILFFEMACCWSRTKNFVRKIVNKLLPEPWNECLKNLFLAASRGNSKLVKKRIKECSGNKNAVAGLALKVAIVYGQYDTLKNLLEDGQCACSKLSVEQGVALLSNYPLLTCKPDQQKCLEYVTAFFEKKASKENMTARYFRRLLQLRFVLASLGVALPFWTYLPSSSYEQVLGLMAAAFDYMKGGDFSSVAINYSMLGGNGYIFSSFWGYLSGLIGSFDKTPRSVVDSVIDNANFTVPVVRVGLGLTGKVLNSKYGKVLTLRPSDADDQMVSYPLNFALDSKQEKLFYKQ